MQYMGGKFRLRKQIVEYLKSIRKDGQVYFEPFVGGANVLELMDGQRVANDLCEPLVALYEAVKQGWIPPSKMSLERYEQIRKENNPKDPLNAYCGFGCSYGGAYFSSYVPVGVKNHAQITHRTLLRQAKSFKVVEFHNKSYLDFEPKGMLIYCDPPYQGTRRYISVEKFDHEKFWNTMREWSKNNTVVISEYSAPEDFICVKSFESNSTINRRRVVSKIDIKTEKLFVWNG